MAPRETTLAFPTCTSHPWTPLSKTSERTHDAPSQSGEQVIDHTGTHARAHTHTHTLCLSLSLCLCLSVSLSLSLLSFLVDAAAVTSPDG